VGGGGSFCLGSSEFGWVGPAVGVGSGPNCGRWVWCVLFCFPNTVLASVPLSAIVRRVGWVVRGVFAGQAKRMVRGAFGTFGAIVRRFLKLKNKHPTNHWNHCSMVRGVGRSHKRYNQRMGVVCYDSEEVALIATNS
jgi:hypothetical protein